MLPIPIKIVQAPGLIVKLFEEFYVFRQISGTTPGTSRVAILCRDP